MKKAMVVRFSAAALVGLLSSLNSGCAANGSRELLIDGIPFQVIPVVLPYDLPEEECYFGKSPYNMELERSGEDVIFPFGVVCGGGDGYTQGTYTEIKLETWGYSLVWRYDEVLKYSHENQETPPRAYRLILTDPEYAWDGDLICRPISIREASTGTVEFGREQIVVFTPREVLIRRGITRFFSCIESKSKGY